MAADVKLEGFDVLAERLRAIVPALRKRVIRNALSAGARLVRDDAKRLAPELENVRRAPYRSKGTVKKAIRVRTSKVARRNGDIGVFVNVKPAPSGQRGAKSRTDPFYWRFLEFGWNPASGPRGAAGKRARRKLNNSGSAKVRSGYKFLTNAAKKLPQALKIFESQVGRWLDKVNQSGKVTP